MLKVARMPKTQHKSVFLIPFLFFFTLIIFSFFRQVQSLTYSEENVSLILFYVFLCMNEQLLFQPSGFTHDIFSSL